MKKILTAICILFIHFSFGQARALSGFNPVNNMPGYIYRDTGRLFLLQSPLYMKNDTTLAIDTSKLWNTKGNIIDSLSFLGSTNSQSLNFRTNDQQRMTISPTGKVGINVSVPLLDFHANVQSGFGDSVTVLNSPRNFNIVGSQAVLRVLRITPDVNTAAPAVELMHRVLKDGANDSWWDFFTNSTGFNIRDREHDPNSNGGLRPLILRENSNDYSIYVDSVGVGINTAKPTSQFNIVDSIGSTARGFMLSENLTSTAGQLFKVRKSRGTFSLPTVVASGDFFSVFDWEGYAGNTNKYQKAARIGVIVNGTVSDAAGGVPADMFFSTSDGTGGLTERVRIKATGTTNLYKGANVASAATITPTGNLFHVTGTTGITSVSGTNITAGTTITIIFDGILTVTDGSNLKLAGNFITTPDATMTLVYDGTNWYEKSRSTN